MILSRRIILICCFFASRVFCYDDEDFPDGYQYQKASPEDVMVDVINNFGLALLEAHNEGNEDNMALSPYGATSVLVALKEGLRGYAAREIETSLRLPPDLSVIRIGLRDVHRHLKSYFIPKEGFLAGLTLSNDKVELLQNYEGVLRFYGYDLESFNNPSYPDGSGANTTSFPEMNTEVFISTSATPVTEEYKTVTETFSAENAISTTESTTGKTEASSGTESSTSTGTTEFIGTSPSKFERTTSGRNEITTESVEESSEETTSPITVPTKSTSLNSTMNTAPTLMNATVSVNSTSQKENVPEEEDKESTTDVIATSITTSVSASTSKFGNDDNTSEKPLTTTTLDFSDASQSDITATSYSYEEESSFYSTESSENSTDNEVLDYSSELISTESDEDSTELFGGNKTRKSRSIVDYLIARYHDGFYDDKRNGRHFEYEPEESLSFFVYGKIKEPNISFMNYDAVLPFAYLPVLDALALSFPLDSSEYYLLLLLPVEVNGIDRLTYDLKTTSSLREIISSLNLTHVKAVIPSFMLKGYVILTSTLQKLGVRKIFEPRHADFSLMTREPNLYVTNIEQAVTVTIRNYIDPEKLPTHRNLQEFRTVEFKADHPFLYFVMDSRIHVTLMAGKIVNPLNSRIR